MPYLRGTSASTYAVKGMNDGRLVSDLSMVDSLLDSQGGEVHFGSADWTPGEWHSSLLFSQIHFPLSLFLVAEVCSFCWQGTICYCFNGLFTLIKGFVIVVGIECDFCQAMCCSHIFFDVWITATIIRIIRILKRQSLKWEMYPRSITLGVQTGGLRVHARKRTRQILLQRSNNP